MTIELGDWLREVANWVFLIIAIPTLFAGVEAR